MCRDDELLSCLLSSQLHASLCIKFANAQNVDAHIVTYTM